MAAPFSKIDFILILNFMENELKSKDEIIENLKKYKQYSQSSETKYGKIGPGRITPKSGVAGEKKAPSGDEDGGDYGIDPLAKLNKLIDSHRIITDGLQTRLSSVSDLYEEVSDKVALETSKRLRYEEENPIDALVFDIYSLNRELDDVKQESHSAAMKIHESHELERTTRSSKRGAAVLSKLVSNRLKLALELASRCQEVNHLEEGLESAKLKSRQLEEKLMQMVGGICEPANQKKRLKAEEISKEINRMLMRLKMTEEHNSRLLNKVAELSNRQHLHQHHLPQQARPLEKNNVASTNSPHYRPASAVGTTFDSIKSQLQQQSLQGPYLSSTAIQILQLREGEKAAPKNLQQAPGHSHLNPVNLLLPNNVPLSFREAGKLPARSTLYPVPSAIHGRGSPSKDTMSKVININIVAGTRFSAKESDLTHFTVNDDDLLNRQKQQGRVPTSASERSVTTSVPTRWPTSDYEPSSHPQHSDVRVATLQHQRQQHLNVQSSKTPGRFPSRSPITPIVASSSSPSPPSPASSVRFQRSSLMTLKPATSSATGASSLPSTSLS